jgi:hypothetical protein
VFLADMAAYSRIFLVTAPDLQGTVSPDSKCMKAYLIKSPWLGHITPIKKFFSLPFKFYWAFKVLKRTAQNAFQFSILSEHY